MKLGPVHVVTDQTMDIMIEQQRRLQSTLDQTLARLQTVTAERDHLRNTANLLPYRLHPCLNARSAPVYLAPPDADTPRTRGIVERVVKAYQQARADYVAPQECVWDYITAQHPTFQEALNLGDTDAVGGFLRRFFCTSLVWGLGMGIGDPVDGALADDYAHDVQILTADLLRGLAEAVGTARLLNAEQNPTEFARALDVDLDELFLRTEKHLGVTLTAPTVGASFGCTLAGRKTMPDYLYHAYTVERLRLLGAKPGDAVAEIGGGYGCLARQFFLRGLTDYAIYDLPWVNVLQGYYLLMTLPEGSVRLYGEAANLGSLAVLPGWCFAARADRSTDWVINTNSLPEMGAETAKGYLRAIGRVLRAPCGRFLSINHECKAPVLAYGPQNCVAELAAIVGGLQRLERARYWMRNSYVEEVYAPIADHASSATHGATRSVP